METQRGGKRQGSGRKPSGIKKKPITVYLETGLTFKFGNETKMKEKICEFVKGYGEEKDYSNLISSFPQKADYIPNNPAIAINQPSSFEKLPPKPFIASLEALKQEILGTTTIKQIEAVMAKIKAEPLLPRDKMMLDSLAKEHSKEMFND